MQSSVFEQIDQSCRMLKVDLSGEEMASFSDDNTLSHEQLNAIAGLFYYLEKKAPNSNRNLAPSEQATDQSPQNIR